MFWLNVVQSRGDSSASFAISSRLATRALPPRNPNDTKPSFVGQISRVRPMFAPRRAIRGTPVFANCAGATMLATSTTSCIETSTCCGTPDHSAVSAANAASGPECA